MAQVLVGFLVLVLGLTVTAGSAPAQTPKRGGTFTFAVATTPPTLDWHTTGARATAVYAGLYIWESLVAMDDKFVPQPMLAERWEVGRDGLTWTFRLRKNVKFHNGKTMTADDVLASLNRWREVSPRAEMLARVKEIVAPDKSTIVFRLTAPMATLPYILSREGNQPVIHPKEIIENAPVNKLSAYVGTGPYKLVEWVPDRHIVLERFPDYAARDDARGGLAGRKVAYLDRIVFKSIPESEVRLAGLKTGEFDAAQPLPQEYVEELKKVPGVQPVIVKFDMKPVIYFSMEGATKNPKLRKAIRAALNMEDIMFAATGNAEFYDLNPDQLWFRFQALWSDTGKDVYNRGDVPLAKRLAQEAGYKGEPLRFLASTTQFHHRRPAIQITEQLKAAGFNVTLDLRDWPTVSQLQKDPSKWEFTYTRTVLTVPSEVELVASMGFKSPEMQKIVDTVNVETDIEKLRTAFDAFKREVIVEQVPWVTMGDMFALRGTRSHVRGLQPIYTHPLWNVWLEK
jgi:peptide/nickel transport system substrate-binding protein